MNTVYLAFGSNLGDRRDNIIKAIETLNRNAIYVRRCSSLIETDPVGGPAQGKYLNAVARAETALAPETLLITLKNIETQLGRTEAVRNGPRIIDIDILLYNEQNIKIDRLTIPHPRMLQRAFVMDPLKEIAPDVYKKLVMNENN